MSTLFSNSPIVYAVNLPHHEIIQQLICMAYKAFKTRLKLNNKQATVMAKHAGFARWVFNWGLKLWMEAYKEGLKPNMGMLKKLFTNHVKPQYPWMSQLSSKVYQYAFIALGDAFKRFFAKQFGYPNFKKKGRADSFTLDNSGALIKIGGLRHKLPFIGWVRTYEALPECVTKKVTISKSSGHWYLSFHVEIPEVPATPKSRDIIGCDLGISTLMTCSDGTVFENPKPLSKAANQLSQMQRHLSRKVKGSSNWRKCLLKVQRLHQRVVNIRRDTIHKLTTWLSKNHGTVVIEDLCVRGMLKNHCVAAAIADISPYEVRRQLEYKCGWYGSELIVADRFFPSSQICSDCGHRQNMPLSSRTFECQNCCSVKCRDWNASLNLKRYPRLVQSRTLAEGVLPTVPVEASSKS
jgi:putative transposase